MVELEQLGAAAADALSFVSSPYEDLHVVRYRLPSCLDPLEVFLRERLLNPLPRSALALECERTNFVMRVGRFADQGRLGGIRD